MQIPISAGLTIRWNNAQFLKTANKQQTNQTTDGVGFLSLYGFTYPDFNVGLFDPPNLIGMLIPVVLFAIPWLLCIIQYSFISRIDVDFGLRLCRCVTHSTSYDFSQPSSNVGACVSGLQPDKNTQQICQYCGSTTPNTTLNVIAPLATLNEFYNRSALDVGVHRFDNQLNSSSRLFAGVSQSVRQFMTM